MIDRKILVERGSKIIEKQDDEFKTVKQKTEKAG
jgi:hypothetical protein